MIPCSNLFLEIEVPDDRYSYLVIDYDNIDGPKWIAPDDVPADDQAFAWFLVNRVQHPEYYYGVGDNEQWTWKDVSDQDKYFAFGDGKVGIYYRPRETLGNTPIGGNDGLADDGTQIQLGLEFTREELPEEATPQWVSTEPTWADETFAVPTYSGTVLPGLNTNLDTAPLPESFQESFPDLAAQDSELFNTGDGRPNYFFDPDGETWWDRWNAEKPMIVRHYSSWTEFYMLLPKTTVLDPVFGEVVYRPRGPYPLREDSYFQSGKPNSFVQVIVDRYKNDSRPLFEWTPVFTTDSQSIVPGEPTITESIQAFTYQWNFDMPWESNTLDVTIDWELGVNQAGQVAESYPVTYLVAGEPIVNDYWISVLDIEPTPLGKTPWQGLFVKFESSQDPVIARNSEDTLSSSDPVMIPLYENFESEHYGLDAHSSSGVPLALKQDEVITRGDLPTRGYVSSSDWLNWREDEEGNRTFIDKPKPQYLLDILSEAQYGWRFPSFAYNITGTPTGEITPAHIHKGILNGTDYSSPDFWQKRAMPERDSLNRVTSKNNQWMPDYIWFITIDGAAAPVDWKAWDGSPVATPPTVLLAVGVWGDNLDSFGDVSWGSTRKKSLAEIDQHYENFHKSRVIPTPKNVSPSGLFTFVISQSPLDGEVDLLEGIGASRPGYKWSNVLTDTSSIKIDRGFDVDQGVLGIPFVGTLEALIQDPTFDSLRTQRVAIGNPIRLRAENQIIWTGIVNQMESFWEPSKDPYIILTSFDNVGLLNAALLEERPYETFSDRMKNAADGLEIPSIIETGVSGTLTPTDDGVTGLAQITRALDSEGGAAWINKEGILIGVNRYWVESTGPTRTSRLKKQVILGNRSDFTDIPAVRAGYVNTYCLSDFTFENSTRRVINGLSLSNETQVQDSGLDELGNPIIVFNNIQTNWEFRNETSSRLYGNASIRLNTNLDESVLQGYADYIFEQYSRPRAIVKDVTFPLDRFENLVIPAEVELDIGDEVQIIIDDPQGTGQVINQTQKISQVQHVITPVEWLTKLVLI